MGSDEEIKKRLERREDMFLRRFFGLLGKMANDPFRMGKWKRGGIARGGGMV